ncbi:MAG: thioredoxin family protein, partial [bacterium]
FSGASLLFLFGLGISTPLIISTLFFEQLSKFTKNNKYFIIILQKALVLLILLFALNLFGDVIKMSEQKNMPLGADKMITPNKLPLFISMISLDCETCEEMMPFIKKLKDSCDGKNIEFRAIDTSDPEFAYTVQKLQMLGTPTYVLMDIKGKEAQRFIGYTDIKDIDAAIFKLTGKHCLKN